MAKLLFTISILMFSYSGYGQILLIPEFDKAVNQLKNENYNEAEKSFSVLLNKVTDDKMKKMCFIYRAFSYNGLGEYQKAIIDLDKAIELDSTDLDSYIDRGKTKGYAADFEGSKKDFLYILAKDSMSDQAKGALYYLGLIAYQQKQANEALSYYDRFLTLVPDDAEIYFNRGCVKDILLLDREGSIKDYDKAIELAPNYAEAYANRGVAKINLLTTRGIIQPSKEQTKDACKDLKKAKELGDNSIDDMIFIYCDKK